MNEIEREDRLGRARLSLKAVAKAALVAGIIIFIFPGGGPWMSYEAGVASMGRVLGANMLLAALYHSVLALLYGLAIAAVIWHQRIVMSILIGVLMGLGLFGANFLLLRPLSSAPQNEMHVLISHILFGLVFSLVYRAMSVPTVQELNDHEKRHHQAH